jgi:ABC-2 type transport system ATP-binding protein
VGDESEERRVVASDDRVTIVLHIQVHQSVLEPVFGIGINRNDGLAVFGTNTGIDRVDIAPIGEGGAVSFTLPRLGLSEGVYTIDAAVHAADGYPYDYRKGVLCFSVRSGRGEIGVISPLREWRFLPHDNEAAALASPDVYS